MFIANIGDVASVVRYRIMPGSAFAAVTTYHANISAARPAPITSNVRVMVGYDPTSALHLGRVRYQVPDSSVHLDLECARDVVHV